MKLIRLRINNRKQSVVLDTTQGEFNFPFSKMDPKPSPSDPLQGAFIDPELGYQGFTYRLESGHEGSVIADQILEYHLDPEYRRRMLLYKLTVQAQKLIANKKPAKREIIRRLKTSPTQFYRLMDQTNTHKTIDQMVKLLAALDCTVEIQFDVAV